MRQEPTRTIVATDEFQASRTLIEPCDARFDEFFDGVEILLSCDATQGTKLTERVWAVDTTEFCLLAPMTVYYTFDDEKVYLLRIELQPEEDSWESTY